MRKLIRLLIESLFDDDFDDIYNNDDLDMELSSKLAYNYKLGDIYYKNDKPYAICCGLNNEFNDNNYRFLYLYNNTSKEQWSINKSFLKLKEPQFHKYDDFVERIETMIDDLEFPKETDDDFNPNDKAAKLYYGYTLNTRNELFRIDENGYENTLIIKNNYKLSDFPAFEYCCKLGDNIYLPSIDELSIMFLNLNKITEKIVELNKKYKLNYEIMNNYYWSSSVLYITSPYVIFNNNLDVLKFKYYYANVTIRSLVHTYVPGAYCIPFFKI